MFDFDYNHVDIPWAEIGACQLPDFHLNHREYPKTSVVVGNGDIQRQWSLGIFGNHMKSQGNDLNHQPIFLNGVYHWVSLNHGPFTHPADPLAEVLEWCEDCIHTKPGTEPGGLRWRFHELAKALARMSSVFLC